ncbi:MAG: hypothetical protein JST92_20940 [Deltaproteobacteria bacterium]|nr:hypothetical protein [Deltaproteobacteria bacterium]
MSERAKVFTNGGSQAVRLPKGCRFPANQRELVARREGKRVVLEPADEWSAGFRACLGAWTEDVPRPAAASIGKLRNPFGGK